uniref:Peptidase S1 domain-containing protein n=1 Tax=Pelusios castaneus TaxID=367368 RepID=A0A8C8SEB8_9SAUR
HSDVFNIFIPSAGRDKSQDQPVFSRIIGGQDAEQNEWPWQVSVQRNGGHVCGGSLISAQWVVSAAHCFNPSVPISQYQLVLGAHNLSSSALLSSEVQQIIHHPSYNAATFVADIALVKLKELVPETTSIRPISLPGASRRFPVGSKCWVTGKGDVEVDKPLKPVQTLQTLEVPILSTTACNNRHYKLWANSPQGPEAIRSDVICAGYLKSSKRFCQGDSGGALACQQDGNWYLAGVESWFMYRTVNRVNCSDSRFRGVFTRVTTYDSWIQESGAYDSWIRKRRAYDSRTQWHGAYDGMIQGFESYDSGTQWYWLYESWTQGYETSVSGTQGFETYDRGTEEFGEYEYFTVVYETFDSETQEHVNGAGPSAVTSPTALMFTALLLSAL